MFPYLRTLCWGRKTFRPPRWFFSGVTDVVDGYIARHYNMITNFGKVYDPFVDKLMQITAIVCLALAQIIPFWIIAIVICKEAAMIIIGGILYLKKIVVHSNWYAQYDAGVVHDPFDHYDRRDALFGRRLSGGHHPAL